VDLLLVDTALVLVALGLVSLLRPLRFLRIRTRRAALLLLAVGVVLFVVGLRLPVVPPRLPGPRTALDEIVPLYQFGEQHEIRIDAPPERVYDAVRAVTAREIRFFRLLTWLRSPRWPGRGRESILNPAADRPILDVALRSGFVLLKEDPGREIVFGAVVCCERRRPPASAEEFRALEGSLARAVMGFHVEGLGNGGSRLVTETRVVASDAAAERRFAAYWRVIYPGSALIRRMWLRAIRSRAEATSEDAFSRRPPGDP
jgi:hypothetical protein